MRALALLVLSACWSTPAPAPIQQKAPTAPELPAPSVAWKDEHLVTRFLPAISSDGTVIVLGPVGMNVGAGMTGGRAFIWDPDWTLDRYLNAELVEHRGLEDDEAVEVQALLTRHAALTGSPRALAMLDDWQTAHREFRLVEPRPEVAAITRKNEGTRATKA